VTGATGIVERLRAALQQKIESGRLDLPLLPEVASQVMKATSDPDCEVRRLADLIQRDASMGAHLLRLANSPLYQPRAPIVSLQQAIGRLGIKKVREIAVVITCESRVFQVRGFENHVRQIFRHSLAAALFAQEIARTRRFNVEEAFLCGLMHDVGKPVLLQALADALKALDGVDRDELLGLVDEGHARVGARLVRQWELPGRLAATIEHHHDFRAAPAETATTAAMTQYSDLLAHRALPGRKVDDAEVDDHAALPVLNLYPDDVAELKGKSDTIRALVEAMTK